MKNQTKTRRLLILLLALFSLNNVGAAQTQPSIIYIAEKDVAAASTQIAVRIADDSPITKIRLSNETDGKWAVKDVSAVKSFLMTVELADGENNFNIIAYAKNKIVYSSESPIVIVRRKSLPTEAAVENPQVLKLNKTSKDIKNVEDTKNKSPSSPAEAEVKNQANGQSVNIRSIIGFEQVGASSAGSKQSPFLNFYFNTPIDVRKNKTSGFSVWGDIRLTTTPVQSVAALSNFNTLNFATSFVQGDNVSKVNDLVQSFNFLVGIEKEIIPPGSDTFSSFLPARTSLSLIAAGGAINPLSNDKTTLFYKIPRVNNNMDVDPRFLALFPEAAGKTNVAFVTPDRDRFFRQYYAGLRLKTFFYDEERRRDYFPAMFDVMFGQNEAITNRLQGVIMRLDGSTPFPVKNTDFLYLFGSVQMKLGKTVNQTIPSFFLEPAAATTTLTNADTVAIPIDRSPFLRSNRDVFRIGVGVDLFKLFKKEETKP